MEISSNNIGSIQSATSVKKLQGNELHSGVDNQKQPLKPAIEISLAGKAHQKIDSLFEQIDSIYMSHLNEEDRQSLTASYAKLDKMFASSDPDAEFSAATQKVFNNIDKIFEKAEKLLTDKEVTKLETINESLDSLLTQEEEPHDEKLFNKIERSEQQQQNLLSTALSSKEKESLLSLNKTLETILSQRELPKENGKNVNELFQNIDNLLNKAFEKLSVEDKEKVNQLDQEISDLHQQLDAS